MPGRYVIGIDFGTLSGRAILVEAETGRILGQKEYRYTHGVMSSLSGKEKLGHGWAIQDPADYLQVLEETIPLLLQETHVPGSEVVGLGCDVTSCTILPVLEDGTPLSQTEAYRNEPHAFIKMWKHHGAVYQAEKIENWAKQSAPFLLGRYGGKVSAQWMLPKVLQMVEEAPEVYRDCELIMEVADWISFRLTGQVRRSTCCAGFKSFWDPAVGYPGQSFFAGLDKRLNNLVPQKLRGEMAEPWMPVGHLTPEWAKKLGLNVQTVVAAGMIDAHAGVLGCGITEPGKLMMILGTSACHILLWPKEKAVPGICGSCKDSVLPGLYAYEAGQACVGDMLDWFVHNSVPEAQIAEAKERSITVHQLLTKQAESLRPGESGLLALDWWNGQRTPLVDENLTGIMLGMTIRTTPAEQYRCLLEAVAFGTKLILEGFEGAGISISEIIACGGIARKNSLLMQICADVLGHPIRVADSDQCSALGAAVLAAVAAGVHTTPMEGVMRMTKSGETVFLPRADHAAVYSTIYEQYKLLVDYFGKGNTMKVMSNLRNFKAGNEETL